MILKFIKMLIPISVKKYIKFQIKQYKDISYEKYIEIYRFILFKIY